MYVSYYNCNLLKFFGEAERYSDSYHLLVQLSKCPHQLPVWAKARSWEISLDLPRGWQKGHQGR